MLALSIVIAAGIALTAGGTDPPPSERSIAHELKLLSTRRGLALHKVTCLRDEVLERTFVCLVEGPDDLHLAWHVRSLPDGHLDVRRPNGSPVSFGQL